MSNEYYVTARSQSTPYATAPVALTAATVTTVAQVATPTTTDILLLGWGVSFNAAAGGTQVPVTCWLTDDSAAATTGTGYTPDQWGNAQSPASLCTVGANGTGYGFTSYVTPGSTVRYLDTQFVSPQTGYAVLWTPDRQPRVNVSRTVRLNCNAPAAVSVIPWILWAEPAV